MISRAGAYVAPQRFCTGAALLCSPCAAVSWRALLMRAPIPTGNHAHHKLVSHTCSPMCGPAAGPTFWCALLYSCPNLAAAFLIPDTGALLPTSQALLAKAETRLAGVRPKPGWGARLVSGLAGSFVGRLVRNLSVSVRVVCLRQ